MHPQYLAPRASTKPFYDAAGTQPDMTKTISYHLDPSWRSFPQGCSQAADPQNTRKNRNLSGILRVDKTNRRLPCLRASKAFVPFPCLSSWQHVAITTLKNSWSLTPLQLALSQHSTANTTKVVNLFSGQASAPVPHHFEPDQPIDMEAA